MDIVANFRVSGIKVGDIINFQPIEHPLFFVGNSMQWMNFESPMSVFFDGALEVRVLLVSFCMMDVKIEALIEGADCLTDVYFMICCILQAVDDSFFECFIFFVGNYYGGILSDFLVYVGIFYDRIIQGIKDGSHFF